MLNKTDAQIVAELESKGRISYAELGSLVGLSKTPCWSRVKNLESNQVITGFSAQVDPNALGLSIRALVHVVINFDQHKPFEQAIMAHQSVRSCHAVTGEFDYVLEILAKDVAHFDELLRVELSRLPGVLRFNTSISTRMIKQNSPYSKML